MQLLDREGKPAGHGQHDRAHDGRHRRAARRPEHGGLPRSGTASAASTTSPAGPRSTPRRLGCTGCSGGGTLTSYLMALDDRIAAAAPSCYITSLERLFATIGPQDAEQNITGQVAFGMDHADYLAMRAPRADAALRVGTRDFFDIQGTWTPSARRSWSTAGSVTPSGWTSSSRTRRTAITRPHREAMLRWMRRWLLGDGRCPDRGRDRRSPRTPNCNARETGQVLSDLQRQVGLRPQRRARDRAGPPSFGVRRPSTARQGCSAKSAA